MGRKKAADGKDDSGTSSVRGQNDIAPAKAHVTGKSSWAKIHDLRPSVKLALGIFILLTFATVFAEWVAPYDPYEPNLLIRNQPQSLQHFFGTDYVGRDTLSRTIFALRTSVGIALFGVFVGTLIGTSLGIIAGLFGGWADRIISSIIDFFYAVPNILIVLVGIAVFGIQTWVLVALISIAKWHSTARLTRGQVFSLRELASVEAAVALGSTWGRVAYKHILPNLTSVLVVDMTLKFPSILLLESTLSFLGLGVQPPFASLGTMVGDGRDYLISSPLIALTPALVMVAIVMCFQVLGDWVRDISDVREMD